MDKNYNLYFTSKDCVNSIKERISTAKTSIDIEMFYFIADDTGLEILNLLKEKAKQGLKIRLLLDYLGSYELSNSKAILEELKAYKIKVLFFNSTLPFSRNRKTIWFLRDHRRTIIIDNEYLFTGSVCVGQSTTEWVELGIFVKDKNMAEKTQIIFNQTWNKVFHPTFNIGSVSKNDLMSGGGFTYITQAPLQFKRHIYSYYIKSIKSCKENIYLIAPYFVPDRRLVRSLIKASKRHVSVNIILPKSTDWLVVDLARNTHMDHLLKHGVRIYFYNTMIHSKFAVFDNKEAFIGTVNLDNLSLRYNYECGIKILNSECVSELTSYTVNDLLPCSEKLDLKTWRKRSLFVKFTEKVVWLFRKLL